jgi:hypothetical protein
MFSHFSCVQNYRITKAIVESIGTYEHLKFDLPHQDSIDAYIVHEFN